ncbi:MAG: polysaccharide deacetylase family protein [Candidatus Acidiferrum sp.]|jgi:peptidoglycan/xylan/chitin deacetylase (PgdA/CDA1 family)
MDPWLFAAPAALAAAGGIVGYGAAHHASQLFGLTLHKTGAAKKLAITFDDGPNPAITPKVLDLFDRHNARATFFLVGDFVRQCPDLACETAARGHSLGNHTHTHPNLFKCGPTEIRNELHRCNDAITEITGLTPKWFRPPFGLRNPWVIPAANSLGMQAVMWTLLPDDWKAPSAEWLIPRMQPIADHAQENATRPRNPQALTGGDILCLHDGNHRQLNGDRRCTLAALEYWLPRWRDLGLEFVTIDEAVRPPAP